MLIDFICVLLYEMIDLVNSSHNQYYYLIGVGTIQTVQRLGKWTLFCMLSENFLLRNPCIQICWNSTFTVAFCRLCLRLNVWQLKLFTTIFSTNFVGTICCILIKKMRKAFSWHDVMFGDGFRIITEADKSRVVYVGNTHSFKHPLSYTVKFDLPFN